MSRHHAWGIARCLTGYTGWPQAHGVRTSFDAGIRCLSREVGLAGDDAVVGRPYSADVVHTAQVPLPLAATFFAVAFFAAVFFVGAFDFART